MDFEERQECHVVPLSGLFLSVSTVCLAEMCSITAEKVFMFLQYFHSYMNGKQSGPSVKMVTIKIIVDGNEPQQT